MVLPHLYDVQKTLETTYKKYGNKIEFNPAGEADATNGTAGGKSPSKHQVMDFYGDIATNLMKYEAAKRRIEGSRKTRNKTNWFYCFITNSILSLLLTGIVIGWCFKINKNYTKWFQNVAQSFKILFPPVLITLAVFILIILVMLLSIFKALTYDKIYTKTYQTACLDVNDPVIKATADMMRTSKSKTRGANKYDSTNPMVVYAYATRTPLVKDILINTTQDCCCSITTTPKQSSQPMMSGGKNIKIRLDVPSFFKKCNLNLINSASKTYNQSMYPFDGNNEINPFVLKRRLQSFDVYGQVTRIKAAAEFFKRFMGKESDEVFSGNNTALNPESQSKIVAGVTKLLTVNALEITKYALGNPSAATQSQLSKNECFASCVGDPDCAIAGYDTGSKLCSLVSASNIGSVKMTFNEAAAQQLLIKDTGSNVPVYGTTLNASFINEHFMDSKNCTDTGCITHQEDATGKIANSPFTIDPSKVFESPIASQPATLDYVYYTTTTKLAEGGNIANIISASKEQFVNKCRGFVQDADPTMTFEFTSEVNNDITKKLKEFYGTSYGSLSSVFSDILSQTQIDLLAVQKLSVQKEALDPKKNKYIPYERFVEKCRGLSSTDFCMQFVFYCEEARVSSSGLYNLFYTYNISDELLSIQTRIYEMSLPMISIALGCIVIAYIWHDITGKVAGKEGSTGTFTIVSEAHAMKQKQDKVGNRLDFALKYVIIIMFVVIILFMFHGHSKKKIKVQEFNRQIFTQNGSTVKDNALDIMTCLFEDVTNKRYNFAKAQVQDSDREFMNIREIRTGQINVNPEVKVASKSYDDFFDIIIKSSVIDNTKFDYTGNNHNLEDIYIKMVDLIEAMEKCNSLFMLDDTTVPIPIVELSLYIIMLVVTLLILFYIMKQFQPHVNLYHLIANYSFYKQLTSGKNVPSLDVLAVTSSLHGTGSKIANTTPISNESFLKITAMVILLAFGVMYCKMISDNVSGFENDLYASHLFANQECYSL
jgi:hypothetical protein